MILKLALMFSLTLLTGAYAATITAREAIDLAGKEQAARDAKKAQASATKADAASATQIEILTAASKRAEEESATNRLDKIADRAAQLVNQKWQSYTAFGVALIGLLGIWMGITLSKVHTAVNSERTAMQKELKEMNDKILVLTTANLAASILVEKLSKG